MRIICIEQLDNGAHANQSKDSAYKTIPDGWAVVPVDLECENFPFGNITVEDVDGVPTVASWDPLPIPEPEPLPELEPTTDEILDAMLGVTSNE